MSESESFVQRHGEVLRRLFFFLFFGIQLAGVVYARLVPTRYLSWAPYDQISFFEIEVDVRGTRLSPEEVQGRYRLPASGRENRSIHHVLNAVSLYEQTYGAGDSAAIRIRYTVNRGEEEVWTYPR
jgi:hypothetical protein